MCFGALGKDVDVQRTISQQIGNFELRGSTDAATLPMVIDDAQNLLLGRGRAHCRYVPFVLTWENRPLAMF